MIKLFTILLLLFFLNDIYAQNSLDFGKVKGDSTFDCDKNNELEFNMFGISSICNSKNPFELRLETFGLGHFYYRLTNLTYDGLKWNAVRYETKLNLLGAQVSETYLKKQTDSISRLFFISLFDSLKSDNAFALPNQEELSINGSSVHDGTAYTFTFKVNNNFRSYNFMNPQSYLDANPKSVELKQYILIRDILESIFN